MSDGNTARFDAIAGEATRRASRRRDDEGGSFSDGGGETFFDASEILGKGEDLVVSHTHTNLPKFIHQTDIISTIEQPQSNAYLSSHESMDIDMEPQYDRHGVREKVIITTDIAQRRTSQTALLGWSTSLSVEPLPRSQSRLRKISDAGRRGRALRRALTAERAVARRDSRLGRRRVGSKGEFVGRAALSEGDADPEAEEEDITSHSAEELDDSLLEPCPQDNVSICSGLEEIIDDGFPGAVTWRRAGSATSIVSLLSSALLATPPESGQRVGLDARGTPVIAEVFVLAPESQSASAADMRDGISQVQDTMEDLRIGTGGIVGLRGSSGVEISSSTPRSHSTRAYSK